MTDPLVEAALQLLPVPEHGPEFWADLDRQLDEVDGPPAVAPGRAPVVVLPVADPTPVPTRRPSPPAPTRAAMPEPSLAVVPPAFRRRSNAILAAVAVAALVVTGLAGMALVQEQSGSGTEVADGDADVTEELDTLVASSQPPAGSPEELSTAQVTASEEAVTAYLADQGEDAPEDLVVTPITTDGESAVAVVTFAGADGIEAYGVRLADDAAEVEPLDAEADIEHVTPAPVDDGGSPATMDLGDDVVVVLPETATAPVLRIDDGTPVICGEAPGTSFTPMDGMDRMRCSWSPEALAAGSHRLTVAYLDATGDAISADSVPFQAA